jgi:hypothetical protein
MNTGKSAPMGLIFAALKPLSSVNFAVKKVCRASESSAKCVSLRLFSLTHCGV